MSDDERYEALARKLDDNLCDGCSRGATPMHGVCELYYKAAAAIRSLQSRLDGVEKARDSYQKAAEQCSAFYALAKNERDRAREVLAVFAEYSALDNRYPLLVEKARAALSHVKGPL